VEKKSGFASVDEYIRSFPGPVRKKLIELRTLVRKLAPDAAEKISYQMPAFFGNRNLVYFAGFSKHIGFYPGANGIARFKSELSRYKHAKGSVQFPLEEPLPAGLIAKMVTYKVAEDAKKGKR
jgi:uncharacterized protein YdhG (YjbR/CyaY superfamily)